MPISLASSFTITVSAGDYNGVVDGLGTLVKSHWIMPASGLTVIDRKVPKVQDGTLSAVVQYLPVPIAQGDATGLSIGVSGTERINVPANAAYNATSGGVGGLFQFDRIDATQQVLFARAGNLAGGMSIDINGGALRAFRFDGDGFLRTVTAPTLPSVGDAHAIFMTWGLEGLELWVDGVFQGSTGITDWAINGTIATTALSWLAWPTDTVGFDGCAGHLLFLGGAQPTPAQIAALSQPESICWANDFNAGTVPESTILSIDIRTGGSHFKAPIVPEIMPGGQASGTASVVGELLRYQANAVTSNQADSFNYRVTSANGKVSTTETVSLTVTEGATSLTMLGSWPLSQTSGNFADATGTNTAVLTVPSWTIATHEYNRPGIVTGSDHALEISNGGPAITMITSPVNYRQAAMSLVVYFEPYSELRGSQYWNEAHEAFGREVIACCDANIDLNPAPPSTAGGFCIYRRRTAWNSTSWRLGGWVRDASGAKQYFGTPITGISSTNLLCNRLGSSNTAHRVVLTQGPAGASLRLDSGAATVLASVTQGWTGLSQPIHIGCSAYTGHANRRSPLWGRVDQIEVWQGQIDPTTGAGLRPAAAQSTQYRVPAGAVLFNVATLGGVQNAMNDADEATGNNNWVYQAPTDTTWYQQPYRGSIQQTDTCRGMIGVRLRRQNAESTTVDATKTCSDSMFAAEGFSVRQLQVTNSANTFAAQGGYTYIGCKFDGNARGQPWSSDKSGGATYCGFNLQQAHLIRVNGNATLTNSVTATFDLCDLYDNSADGISQGEGTHVTAKGCRFYGTYRGPFVHNNLTHNDTIVMRCESFESAEIIGGRIENGGGTNDLEPFNPQPLDRNFWDAYDYWGEGDLDDVTHEAPGQNSHTHYFNVHTTRGGLAVHPERDLEPCSDILFQRCTLSFYRRGFVSSPSSGGNWPKEMFRGFSAGVSGLGALLEECVFLANGRPASFHQFGRVDPVSEDGSPECRIIYETAGLSAQRLLTMRNCQFRATRLPSGIALANTRCLTFPSLSTGYVIEIDGLTIDPAFADIPITLGGITIRHRNVLHERTGSTTPWSGAGAVVPI